MEGFLQYVAGLNEYDAMRNLRTDIEFLEDLCNSALTKLHIQGNVTADLLVLIGRIEELKRDINERLSHMRSREYFEPYYTEAIAKYTELEGVLEMLEEENERANDPQAIANEDPARGGRRKRAKAGRKTKRVKKGDKRSKKGNKSRSSKH
jgi:hypothetical protein